MVMRRRSTHAMALGLRGGREESSCIQQRCFCNTTTTWLTHSRCCALQLRSARVQQQTARPFAGPCTSSCTQAAALAVRRRDSRRQGAAGAGGCGRLGSPPLAGQLGHVAGSLPSCLACIERRAALRRGPWPHQLASLCASCQALHQGRWACRLKVRRAAAAASSRQHLSCGRRIEQWRPLRAGRAAGAFHRTAPGPIIPIIPLTGSDRICLPSRPTAPCRRQPGLCRSAAQALPSSAAVASSEPPEPEPTSSSGPHFVLTHEETGTVISVFGVEHLAPQPHIGVYGSGGRQTRAQGRLRCSPADDPRSGIPVIARSAMQAAAKP